MAQQPFIAKIVGIPHIPAITEVNIRTGPSTDVDIKFKSPVGTSNLMVIEVQEDSQKRDLEGKVYQWFRVNFPQGDGWIRDDLIEVSGDGTTVGYPIITTPITAFSLVRRTDTLQPGEEIVGTATVQQQAPPPAVETPEVTQPVAVETPAATGDALAIAMVEGVKLRPGPGSSHEPVAARIPYRHTAKILDSSPSDDGVDFLWVKLSYQGKEGWAREDLIRYQGAFGTLGLSADDKYPSPAPKSRWVRDFAYPTADRLPWVHWGWDHSEAKGAPILAGPKGGKVIAAAFCQRCGTQGSSAPEKGFSLSDQRVLGDQGWNFGYGHYIIVRYTNDLLPESTRAELAERGFDGAHIFVMHAHLQDMLVKAGDDLQPNQQIATMGNSGNSEGPHLHLEIRAHASADETRWAVMKQGLMTPQVLFLR